MTHIWIMLELHVGMDGGRTNCTTVMPTIHVWARALTQSKTEGFCVPIYIYFFLHGKCDSYPIKPINGREADSSTTSTLVFAQTEGDTHSQRTPSAPPCCLCSLCLPELITLGLWGPAWSLDDPSCCSVCTLSTPTSPPVTANSKHPPRSSICFRPATHPAWK